MNSLIIVSYGFELIFNLFNKGRFLLYLVLPSECMFSSLDHVPHYIKEMFPVFIAFAIIENGLRIVKGKSILRLNESIASISQGIFQECIRINVRALEVIVYCYVYNNFRCLNFPWNSLWTWWFCLIFVDFLYYWGHRLSHEINFLWAIHQAHHSSEDFNLIAGLRQAALQPFTAWAFFIPLALFGIPPPIYLVHFQLGELYMLWVHTEVIQSLGPLEVFLNSPSHHRVHHGRNRKYIDKNYAGILILWDRWFGTFQPEDPNEPVVYGLVHPVQSYNPFYLQFHHWTAIFKSIYHNKGWKNKLLAPFKGPGWAPGKPRLGYLDDIPLIEHPATYWDPQIPLWQKLYTIWHFGIVLLFYHELADRHDDLKQFTVTIGIISLLTSITSIGFILENRKFAFLFEFLRCIMFFTAEQFLPSLNDFESQYKILIIQTLRSTFLISAILSAILTLHSAKFSFYNKMKTKKFCLD